MKGTISRRSGGYIIRYEIGKRWDETNQKNVRKQKQETVPRKKRNGKWVPPNKGDAQALLAERLSQLNRGEFIEPSNITFQEFKDIWMSKYANGAVRPSTIDQYQSLYKNHIIPYLGSIKLSQIGVEDIQGFKSTLQQKNLGEQMVKHNLRLVRQMLKHAVDWEHLRKNPAEKVKFPKLHNRDKEMESHVLSPQDVGVFLDHVPEKWYAFFLVAITGGLRIGELIAMKWDNLDWTRGQYFVRESWVRPKKDRAASIGSPKSESSRAPVDLIPTCLESLKEHRTRQAGEKLKAGQKYQDQGLIFATAVGGLLHDINVVQRVFKPALEDAGLPTTMRFHDLRHTCASLLIHQGENPKYIQKQMRHASIDMTFDRYGHLFPDTNKEAAQRLDDTLFGSFLKDGELRG
jgi:integrase